MKLFSLTLIAFCGLLRITEAKVTDDLYNDALDIVSAFQRLQISDQEDPRQSGISVVDAAATFIVGAVDTMVLPLEFGTYALVVFLLRAGYGTIHQAIKVANSEE